MITIIIITNKTQIHTLDLNTIKWGILFGVSENNRRGCLRIN